MTAVEAKVAEGSLLWTPPGHRIQRAQLTQFMFWLDKERGFAFSDYNSLWRWSVEEPENFWQAIWDYFQIISDALPRRIVDAAGVFGARWFEGSRTNYAEHLLRHEGIAEPDEVAICHSAETRQLAAMSWSELGAKVRKMATRLREMGIVPGDRIVSYMPNIPETAIAMLATVAIGGVWSSAAPEFGPKTILDRFSQIQPKLLFAADGYSFGGRIFDRRDEIDSIVAGLPTLETLVWTSFVDLPKLELTEVSVIEYARLLDGPDVPRSDFVFERVAPDHPLWILFSSGTTGLPKAIVHGHAGMIAEHLKVMTLHCDLGPRSRMFFYSTTGWMMWNSVLAALITGSSCVLYDGSPVHGGVDMLWRMAADSGTTMFGASPTLVKSMEQAGVRPGERFDLSALDTILVGGAPSTPETFRWFYDNVKSDLWVTSQSGGTEFCSGLAVGTVIQPVHAGEIQARALGTNLQVWNDDGHSVLDEPGELVVVNPTPSMPLYFWGDESHSRYLHTYFSDYPGIWRHGDLAKINNRGGVYVYGRSDSTLNRFGVRIGSAEIYSVIEKMAGVSDSLVVCCEMPGGAYYMPLFVVTEPENQSPDLQERIVRRLREEASPRHVPDEIHFAPAIPYTLTGKKMEVPIRKLLMGMAPENVASRDAMANPALLDWYAAFAGSDYVTQRRRDAQTLT